jgi:hypothetical protein
VGWLGSIFDGCSEVDARDGWCVVWCVVISVEKCVLESWCTRWVEGGLRKGSNVFVGILTLLVAMRGNLIVTSFVSGWVSGWIYYRLQGIAMMNGDCDS